jgi:hypothetical protein
MLRQPLAHLMREPAHLGIVEIGRQTRFLVPALPFDFLGLPLDVAAVLGLHVHLQGNLHGQAFVRAPVGGRQLEPARQRAIA